MAILTRDYFDHQQCSAPGCKHTAHDKGLYISAGCHPGAPVYAVCLNGVITFTFSVCERYICEVAIAP